MTAELWERLVLPAAYVYSLSLNNSSQLPMAEFCFFILYSVVIQKAKERKLPCSVKFPYLCVVLTFPE
jgi:hypothetical protein